MDELKISVDVGLDEKAQSSINKDLSKLKATMPVKLQIENINSIKNQLKDISFKINVDDASFNGLQTKAKKVTADIQNELKKIQNIDFGKTLSQNNTNTKSLGLQIYNTDYVKKQVNEVLNIVKQTKPVISKELNELNSFQLKNNVKANTSNLFSGLKQDLTQTKSLLKDFNQDTSREMKIINSTLNSMSSSKIIDVNQIKVQTEQGVKALEQASYKIASTKKSFDSKLVAQENKILQGQINNFLNNPRLNKNARDNYAKILQELNDNPKQDKV